MLVKAFTDEEVAALLNVFVFSDYLSARNKLILAIAFDTGARSMEESHSQSLDSLYIDLPK